MIELVNGGIAQCDATDIPLLSQYRWSWIVIHNRMYVTTHIKGKRIYMHRMLMPEVKEVDHKDRNGLNNCRDNLRPCTHSQNIANSDFTKSESGYRGVRLMKKRTHQSRPWQARIKINGKQISLGYFATAEDGAKAYDIKAKELFGEFAFQNFPVLTYVLH